MNEHLVLVALLIPGIAAAELQPPLPRVATTCPAGYHRSGDYCVPTSEKAKPAMPRVGTVCPPGHHRNGAYCLSTK